MSQSQNGSSITYSVVVPVYKEEDTISQCLDSVLQTGLAHPQLEILVVDGMSEDRTPEIVTEYAAEHESIQLLENPDRTTPSGLNLGFRESSNDVIVMLSGHSRINSEFFHHLDETFTDIAPDAGVVGGRMAPVGDTYTERAIAASLSTPIGSSSQRFEPVEGYVETVNFGAYRRRVVEDVGLLDEELPRAQDYEYNRRVRDAGYKIYQNPSIKAYYSPRSSYMALSRQYYGNGIWKANVHRTFGDYPLPPELLLLGLVLAGGIGLSMTAVLIPVFAVGVFAYLLLLWCTGVKTLQQRNDTMTLLPGVVAALIVIHASFGTGFLLGTVRGVMQ
ncbi:Glycosyltransferase, catalytic subunit of cellulose synthase and poly-beta-1,6-N-acetylglucosamine synthase [Halomicrobium zhouii]|uniref:Glycosyltransferase, catalytic subunit of cellulose synthase and poly-beta-1,6-N-acetylglucosamine synthase n=1 Tax=Halomicrobium zhouii TaxID=767519 RepID=A0A1I6KFW3_9EURY|nr:glycosyltransferase family 2 protein [Halomicrobium zhouii]SFR90131.1 Glycosyltransferase, catalytic subunit of cellulose synthase and poly-beta-1,6-N-acetylglucosamine synthase [Halomicrobium zhouii]